MERYSAFCLVSTHVAHPDCQVAGTKDAKQSLPRLTVTPTAVATTASTRSRFLTDKQEISIVWGEAGYGTGKEGAELGPSAICTPEFLKELETLSWRSQVRNGLIPREAKEEVGGDIGILKKPFAVAKAVRRVYEETRAIALQRKFALLLGGDHSLSIGSIAGSASANPDLCVVWVDAHTDINTPQTTLSGNLHGMPVAVLLGLESCNVIPGFEMFEPCLTPNRVVYIGVRDLDPGEKQILRNLNIKAYSMHEVELYGIARVVQMALDDVNPERTRPIHLSFDIDGLDPREAPSTGTPVRGGLSFREGRFICEELNRTGLLVSMDLMEVNPAQGTSEDISFTVSTAQSLIYHALGKTLL